MATKLGLYNEAALILKLRNVDSLTENTPTRITFDHAYAVAVDYMLGQASWHFASRVAALTAETTTEPSFGYNNYFAKPDDFARLIEISRNDNFFPTLDEFSEEAGYWAANCDPLYIKYVSTDAQYGGDLGRWTPHFTRATAFEIAERCAGKLTKMSEGDLDRLEKRKMAALHKAKSSEAYGQPVKRPPPGSLVRARMGARQHDRYPRDR